MEKFAGFTGLFLLGGGVFLLAVSVRKGKRIVEHIKRRHPQQWDAMGKPAPGYFQSMERNRWMKFIRNREYLQFNDPTLTEMGDAQYKLENLTLGWMPAFIIVFGGMVLWLELAG